MHTDRTAQAFIEHALFETGEDANDYDTMEAARLIRAASGTWDMEVIAPDDFWAAVTSQRLPTIDEALDL